MAHLIIEYSSNLEKSINIKELVGHIHQAATGTGVFPLKGIRTRCAPRDFYRIADGDPDNAFVHVIAKIGHGRSDSTKQKASGALFLALTEYLADVFEKSPLSISLEMQEIDALTTHKQNNLEQWIERRTLKTEKRS